MLLVCTLLVLLPAAVRAIVCPPDDYFSFNQTGDYSCSSNIWSKMGRTPSPGRYTYSRECANADSLLPKITNAFMNTALQQQALSEGVAGVWLSLYCLGNTPSSCIWDDETPMKASDYNNFVLGSPKASTSACVLLNSTTSQWQSYPCNPPYGVTIAARCDFNVKQNISVCGKISVGYHSLTDYYEPTPFNNFCYFPGQFNYTQNQSQTKSIKDAQAVCSSLCGNLVSIHSEGENSFVRDVLQYWVQNGDAVQSEVGSQSFLGKMPGVTQWYDGSTWDFTNFVSSQAGDCAFLNDSNSDNSWYSGPCSISFIESMFVCKRDMNAACSPATNALIPPITPTNCSAPQFIDGRNGSVMFYSPGYPYYPYGAAPNHCEWIFTTYEGMDVSFTMMTELSYFAPDDKSTWKVYTSENSTEPSDSYCIDTSSPDPYPSWSSYSPNNYLRLVYDTPGDVNYLHNFKICITGF